MTSKSSYSGEPNKRPGIRKSNFNFVILQYLVPNKLHGLFLYCIAFFPPFLVNFRSHSLAVSNFLRGTEFTWLAYRCTGDEEINLPLDYIMRLTNYNCKEKITRNGGWELSHLKARIVSEIVVNSILLLHISKLK